MQKYYRSVTTMKNFNIEEIIKDNKAVMIRVGIWPEEVPSIRYTLRVIIILLTTILITIFLIMQAYRDFTNGEIEDAVYEICLILVCGYATFILSYLHYNKKPLFQIFKNLKDPVLTSHEDIFDRYVETQMVLVNRLYKFFLVACISTAFAIFICDFIYDYKTGPHTLAINATYNDTFLYIFAWYLYSVGIFLTACIIGAFHGLEFILIFAADAHLEILYKQIIYYATESTSLNLHDQLEVNEKVNSSLRSCVIRHNAIERFIVSVERGLSYGFLVQLLVTLSLTALVGFNFIFVSIDSPNFIRCILFFVANLIQLAALCFACNEVTLQSAKIRDACYISDWNKYDSSVRKTLFIIMERSKRPLKFTAGKFAVISLDTFVTVLKMAMSYFAFLKKVYVDPK